MERLDLVGNHQAAVDAAIQTDDAFGLITALSAAIAANGWIDDGWSRLSVGGADIVWHVLIAGKPKCFQGICKFIYENAGWSQLLETQRDGRLTRFPQDALQYIQTRKNMNANLTIPQILSEIEPAIHSALMTQSLEDIDDIARRFVRAVGPTLAGFVDESKRTAASAKFALKEAEELAAAVPDVILDSARKIRSRL